MIDAAALREELLAAGASLVGFADLAVLRDDEAGAAFRQRLGVDVLHGIAIAVSLPCEVVAGLGGGPTRAYYDAYQAINERLDALATLCADKLEAAGHRAWAQTRQHVADHDKLSEFASRLPHKTVATLAGLGWIGKNALLVNKRFGSALRITSVLTDAELPCDAAVSVSHCGSCDACVKICPADALHNAIWVPGVTSTAEIVDVERCSIVAAGLSKNNYGISCDICGKCFWVCPFTRKWAHAGI